MFESLVLRDELTARHSLKMAYYNQQIAKKFDPQNSEMYYLGGIIHDIGKLSMPDEILKGRDKLNDIQKSRIKDHVIDGVSIAKNLNLPDLILDIVMYHHERYDGSGYIKGFKGKNIPLAARISAISDTYTTLIAGRLYRQAVSKNEAMEIMEKDIHLFDPEIFYWFKNAILNDNFFDEKNEDPLIKVV